MEAQITQKEGKSIRIEWSDEKLGYGNLSIEYLNNGKYMIDAEYLNIETIRDIFAAINNWEMLDT